MDRAQNAPAHPPQRNSGHRDMMFCHECSDEWYRDERGLRCPECGSDFTEIIEDNNDPRDNIMDDDDGDHGLLHEHAQQHQRNLPRFPPFHHPFQNDDPEEGDISNVQFTQTAPGRFNVHATVTRSISPTQIGTAGGPASIGGFMSILNGLTRAAAGQTQGQSFQGQGEGLFTAPGAQNQQQSPSAFNEARGQGSGQQPHVHTSRFTYHGGARLHPRDANNPGPRIEPVDDLTNVVTSLMASFGMPPGTVQFHQQPGGSGEAIFTGTQTFEHNHDHHQQGNHPLIQNHPLLHIFTSLGLVPPSGQVGDFVYSQEGLDRIVSQLMEQTATSNAPGPASQTDINRLPRKKVDVEMLGAEHRAECSICMDEVNIGEQVTVLPCKHWFHHPCVSAWLTEHDTCPHCRKGITQGLQDQDNMLRSQHNATQGQQSIVRGRRNSDQGQHNTFQHQQNDLPGQQHAYQRQQAAHRRQDDIYQEWQNIPEGHRDVYQEWQNLSQRRQNTYQNPSEARSQTQYRGSGHIPGAFDAAGSSTSSDSFVVPGDVEMPDRPSSAPQTGPSDAAGNGGIADRIRRGLFGAPQ